MRLCKAGSFSAAVAVCDSESTRTPPREGTSLHGRNNSVERPWGILSLFTITNCEFTLPEPVTQPSGTFTNQAVFYYGEVDPETLLHIYPPPPPPQSTGCAYLLNTFV